MASSTPLPDRIPGRRRPRRRVRSVVRRRWTSYRRGVSGRQRRALGRRLSGRASGRGDVERGRCVVRRRPVVVGRRRRRCRLGRRRRSRASPPAGGGSARPVSSPGASSDADSSGGRTSPSPAGTRSHIASSWRAAARSRSRWSIEELLELVDVTDEELAPGDERLHLVLGRRRARPRTALRASSAGLLEQLGRHLAGRVERALGLGARPRIRCARPRPWRRRSSASAVRWASTSVREIVSASSTDTCTTSWPVVGRTVAGAAGGRPVSAALRQLLQPRHRGAGPGLHRRRLLLRFFQRLRRALQEGRRPRRGRTPCGRCGTRRAETWLGVRSIADLSRRTRRCAARAAATGLSRYTPLATFSIEPSRP